MERNPRAFLLLFADFNRLAPQTLNKLPAIDKQAIRYIILAPCGLSRAQVPVVSVMIATKIAGFVIFSKKLLAPCRWRTICPV